MPAECYKTLARHGFIPLNPHVQKRGGKLRSGVSGAEPVWGGGAVASASWGEAQLGGRGVRVSKQFLCPGESPEEGEAGALLIRDVGSAPAGLSILQG
jgi:hypothetical protein